MNSRHIAIIMTTIAATACATVASAHRDAHVISSRWALETRLDRFTGETHCRLGTRNHRILYQPGALGFAFGDRVDTFQAQYRVDGDAVVRWQDRYPALIAAGAQVDGRGLVDPTGGIVWIPLADLAGAKTVTIRATSHGRPRSFAVTGLADELADASAQHCRFDSLPKS